MWYDSKDVCFFEIKIILFFQYNESNKLIKSFDDQGARFGPSFPSEGLKVKFIFIVTFFYFIFI
jgi:hypothetical protein